MDILRDNSHATLYRIRGFGFPDYVKSAAPLSKEAAASLSDAMFADGWNRFYPIDSKASTWLSAAYFAKTAEDEGYASVVRENVERTIKEAAKLYGILEDVEDVMKRIRFREPVKLASEDPSNYGWFEGRKYPMFDEEGVKKANAYFEENAYKYPPSMRHGIATNILRKSAEYGVEPSPTVEREAGRGIVVRDFMAHELMDRANRVGDFNQKMAAALLKATKKFMEMDAETLQRNAVKFASTIEEMDRACGLDREYGRTVRPPSEIFFHLSVKQAKDLARDTVALGGQAFSVEKLAELPPHVFTNALGDEFFDRVKSAEGEIDAGKLGDELHSMPKPDREALYRSIRLYAE